MGIFKGERLSVSALLERAQADESSPKVFDAHVGLRHTAQGNAKICVEILRSGGTLDECWRFGILQTLDDYNSTLRRGGKELAGQVFGPEPDRTGARELNAAFAALADHLAQRDGWKTPQWALSSHLRTQDWFPSVPQIFRTDALRQSPPAFRERGIFITDSSLARA